MNIFTFLYTDKIHVHLNQVNVRTAPAVEADAEIMTGDRFHKF